MVIANIYPIANQQHYKDEQIGMVLAHLVKQGKYDPKNFPEEQYLIMDNGLFENAQVSTNLEDLVMLAENSGLPIKEIVIPDCMFNFYQTCELFEMNLSVIRKWQHKYAFMFVAQYETIEQLGQAIQYINRYPELDLVVGIPKLGKEYRSSPEMIELYKQCKFPVHFLGLRETFDELRKVKDVIRSCDTAQVCIAAKYRNPLCLDLAFYERKKSEVIDLENDVIDEDDLNMLLKSEKEFYKNGIL